MQWWCFKLIVSIRKSTGKFFSWVTKISLYPPIRRIEKFSGIAAYFLGCHIRLARSVQG